MTSCQNCNYKLVLLPRGKYKCSLCSKLYPQKQIENREFREWNKRQRELDAQNLKTFIKLKPRFRLSKEERKLRAKESARRWSLRNKEEVRETHRKWRDANREHYTDQKREYYNRNLKHVNSKQKENYAKNKEKIIARKERWQENNPYGYRMKKRLADLRYQQKLLALKHVKNNELRRSPTHSEKLLPTFLHSDLLALS